MPTKAEMYAQMAEKVAVQLTGSWQEWAGFLTNAARLYKYPFHEQLMIYAQRPDATACAEYDLWNNRMGRYVRRGSKGIALVDDSGDRPRLRYVFDISDTGTREHSRTPWLWTLNEEHTAPVMAMLERNYDVSGSDLAQQLADVSAKLAEEYWADHRRDILPIVDGSFLEEYDEYNIEVQFKSAATVSITYALMSRCGLEPEQYFSHEDFMPIFDFNTPAVIGALGTAVSQANQQVLRQIGVTIQNYERAKSAERSATHGEQPDLHSERGLPDSRPAPERAAGEAPGQVRQDAQSVPEAAPAHPLQPAADDREAVPAPSGDRRDGEPAVGADDVPTGRGGGRDGGAESRRPDAVGGPAEHLQSPGRGDSAGGTYQQLTLNLFLTEAEQIQQIDEAESVKTPSAFSFAQADIDHVLRLGGNTDRFRERVAVEFEKQKPISEIAAYLPTLYHGGSGVGGIAAWCAEDGIHLSHGKSARYDRSAQLLSWQDAAERIGQLLEAGQFASNVELAEAESYELSLLADEFWSLYHDLSEEARNAGYLQSLSHIQGNGFPEESAWLTGQLANPAFRAALLDEYQQFLTAHQDNRALLRFHYHHLEGMLARLRDLDLPRNTFSTELAEVPSAKRFITEDEIDAALTSGIGMAGGKGRIFAFFQESHTDKEKVDFLKHEYGIGGRSHALSGAAGSDEWYDGKGLRFKKAGCPDVHLTWDKAAKRITGLIQQGRYLSAQEQAELEQRQEEADLAEADAMAAQQAELSIQDSLEQYKPIVRTALEADTAYRNACGHSDHENAVIEGNAAVRRAVLNSGDLELIRLYSDVPEFRHRLHREVIDETYPHLHELLRPLSQDDIDDALRAWNGNADSKRAVIHYMEAHAREKDTAAWLAHEFDGGDGKTPFAVRPDSPEGTALPWPKVQRRIAQLIQEDKFLTEQESQPDWNEQDARRYQVVVYHHFENGFDERLEYPTLEEAEKVAQGYVDGTMGPDGFAYDGAAIYDLEQRTYLRIIGNYPDEAAQAQVAALDLSGQPVTREGDTLTIGSGEPTHEMDITVSDEEYEAIRQAIPETEAPTAYAPATPPYHVGDTVYLDNQEYQITELREDTVQLLPSNMAYPIYRAESQERFETLLRADTRNEAINEFLPVNPDTADQDLRDVLVHGLIGAPDKAELSELLHTGKPNREIAQWLGRAFPGVAETMELETGDTTDYRTTSEGIELEVLDADKKRLAMLFFRWDEVAPLLRGLYARQLDGFGQEQAELYMEAPAAVEEPAEAAKPVEEPAAETPAFHSEPVAVYPGEQNQLPYDVVVERLHVDQPEPHPPENFYILDDDLGKGGPKEKFWRNIKAIATLKQIEQENRYATPEEQHIFSQYVGWGGLADAFDPDKPAWAAEYAELKELLTPEEYEAARASTLNAHYTSPTVIRAIYDAVEQMGFRTGNILEPSCGVGNFFGMLPESMAGSRLYGVELDSISGRIAKQLYPKADITVAGFETTDRRDFYDLAIGNVPFGQYQVNDKAYNKLGFNIHNYFFAKSLDQVRPGGVVAFVTSRYTMDAKDSTVRRYLAQRAELLGAIRLPNNAFKANAGTEVVSDILFLQKRDRPLDITPDWTQTGRTEEGFTVNQYFLDHPEMVLGRQEPESTAHGMDYTVNPIEGMELADQLHNAVQHIHGTYQEAALPELGEGEDIDDSLPADPDVKNYSYTVVDGAVYFRENSRMVRPDLNAIAEARVKGLVGLRDCVQQLIDLEMDAAAPDADIRAQMAELNRRYDDFSEKYGLINDRANRLAFADDSSYYLLCALEVLDEDGRLERKADMFTKRTIKPHEAVTTVDTASEALAVSISEKACVDMAYMEQLTGKTGEELADELRGVIFRVPGQTEPDGTPHYVTADEYLSGNVRRKLRQAQRAAEQDPVFAVNVEALTAAQPKDLDASEIEVRLGATWIDKEYIQQFMYETFDTPFYLQRSIEVRYSAFTAEWQISGKNAVGQRDVAAYTTYGTNRANAYKILEDSLNLRDVRIYDTVEDADGKERRVLNAKETTLAAQKQQAIREAFKDWIWRDPERRQALVRQYNEEMNATRPREYDGSHIVFGGMNPSITLREHQKNAIAHVLYGGNTLLAHEVGAGKTFEMVGAAMEAKRLGLCQKSLFVVPNHLTEQWASEFLRLYPSANILVTTKKDFEKHNRKKFCARIATGDYDAIIMGHSQFEKIPISKERQERLLHEQIWEITEGISEVEASGGERFTVKQLERTKKSLEARLEKLQAEGRKDDVVTFEQLGVDRLFVDEAHNYKNLFLYTKMRNVAGLSTTDAQKSSDMFAKCRYMDEITGSRGVIFATGTPVSNSMTELYTMQRYLQYDRLQELGMAHFDCWASRFGETVTALELAPEGTGYRARTRFSKFFNLPELMNLFKEVADIKTADQLHLPTPQVEYHNVVAQPTDIQKEMVKTLSERASEVHRGSVDPSVDNMLKITSDGRKLGLDQRIINRMLPDEPGTKVNQCVDNIMQIWRDGEADKLTQLVFCDISTPQTKPAKKVAKALDNPTLHALEDAVPLPEPEPAFTVYEDIRQKLIAKGVPAEQIAFIHEANTEVRKKELFSKVRTGQVRVLLGSTQKMGAGTNVQDRLVALHDLDCPWRPGDLAQRKGRIERQGNQNETVHVFRYVTEGTFDAYLWQTVENKQKFISQIMTSKSPVRSCDDVDETALSFAEIKALCAGDPRIKERMDLDVDVSRLKLLKADHQSKQYRLEDQLLKTFPEEIEKNKGFIAGLEADMKTLAEHPHPEDGFAGMEVRGDTLTDKENAGAALLDACKEVKGTDPVPVGSYRGFAMSVSFDAFRQEYMLLLKGQMTHRATLGTDPRGNLTRIDNALSQMPQRLEAVKNQLDNLYQQQAAAKAEVGKPFPQEQELRDKSARLAELDVLLNMDGRGRPAPEAVLAKSSRPSVLEGLKRPVPPRCSEKKPKHHEQEVR
ncbi:MAG: DEAD/DEAH box helicase family protein [Mobilibacterium timonense]|nr:DEAD/DEAH box helicase family protein [Mobilibacterium timonense]